jgi:YidC/Oxa1 family membrane protein insertase
MSYLSPSFLYEQLDIFSRDALLYVANDLGYGFGTAILSISLAIKIFFVPLMIKTQINGIKMKLIEPEMKNFQNTIQRYSRAGDFAKVRELQGQFKQLRKLNGINNMWSVLSLTQIPILITWFLSLRWDFDYF